MSFADKCLENPEWTAHRAPWLKSRIDELNVDPPTTSYHFTLRGLEYNVFQDQYNMGPGTYLTSARVLRYLVYSSTQMRPRPARCAVAYQLDRHRATTAAGY